MSLSFVPSLVKTHRLLNVLLIFGVVWCGGFVSSYAQDAPASRMVISYDDEVQGSEAEQWHLEEFREVLLKEPATKTYIIAYNGREDSPG